MAEQSREGEGNGWETCEEVKVDGGLEAAWGWYGRDRCQLAVEGKEVDVEALFIGRKEGRLCGQNGDRKAQWSRMLYLQIGMTANAQQATGG